MCPIKVPITDAVEADRQYNENRKIEKAGVAEIAAKRAKTDEAAAKTTQELSDVLDKTLSSPNFECDELKGLSYSQYWALIGLACTHISELLRSMHEADEDQNAVDRMRVKRLRRFCDHASQECLYDEEEDENVERDRLRKETEEEQKKGAGTDRGTGGTEQG